MLKVLPNTLNRTPNLLWHPLCGKIPAATLWWGGFTISKNISDEDTEASFRAMVHGISPRLANAHPNQAVWIIKGFRPTAEGKKTTFGVIANFEGGAKPYPMLPYMGL